jgi:hypothetical protein
VASVCVSKLVLYFDFGDFDAQKLEYFMNFSPYVLFFPAALSRKPLRFLYTSFLIKKKKRKCLIPVVFLRIFSR